MANLPTPRSDKTYIRLIFYLADVDEPRRHRQLVRRRPDLHRRHELDPRSAAQDLTLRHPLGPDRAAAAHPDTDLLCENFFSFKELLGLESTPGAVDCHSFYFHQAVPQTAASLYLFPFLIEKTNSTSV